MVIKMKWLKEKIKNNERISLDDMISSEGDKYPLLKELKQTEQDPEWHSEGDVHIHTNMVIDEIYKIFEKETLSLSEKYILLMSAIFHDIGKTKTSKWKEVLGKQHLTAKGHEYEGMSYLTYRLLEEDMTKEEYNSILDLVGYHQVPKLLIVKDNISKWDYKLLTEKTSGKLFYLLELADMLGRTCIDKEDQVDYIEMFKMYAIDYNCYETKSNIDEELRKLFINQFNENDESALSFLIGKTKKRLYDKDIIDPVVSYQKYYENKNNHGVLYLMCGISGSGKTTTINNIKKDHTIDTVIELDTLRQNHKLKSNNRREIDGRVRQESKELLKRALANKESVIFDACNHRKDFRDVLFGIAEEYKAKTVLVFVQTSFKDCIKNDQNRNVRNLGKEIINTQKEQFQYPERYEANETYYK